jgi:hypothetical protein
MSAAAISGPGLNRRETSGVLIRPVIFLMRKLRQSKVKHGEDLDTLIKKGFRVLKASTAKEVRICSSRNIVPED